MGSERSMGKSVFLTAQFLLGRLAGYLLFAILAWMTQQVLLKDFHYHSLFYGAAYLLLAVTLFIFGFRKPKTVCAGSMLHNRITSGLDGENRPWMPLSIGFLTGLNFCPPFLLAFTGAAGTGSLWGSLFFFATFFLGTSIYFIPAPFLGMFGRNPVWRQIGRWAALIVGVYYLYLGLVTMIGGLIVR